MSGRWKILLALVFVFGCGSSSKPAEEPEAAGDESAQEGETPVSLGERLYQEKGCKACHSIDGSESTGPSFKGLWGKEEVLEDGSSVLVDANYVRRSVLEPSAEVVRGYNPQMPSFRGKLSDEEIGALVVFIASLP